MQLSIEAIIILVIAMVLLGLGISFVTSMLRGGSDKLETIVGQTEVPCTTNAQNTMTLTPNELTVKKGDELTLKFCLYAEKDYSQVTTTVTCGTGSQVASTAFMVSGGAPMKMGQNAQFQALFTAPAVTAKSRGICTVKAMGTPTSGTAELIGARDVTIVVNP